MAIQKRGRGGRPGKGARHVLTTRLPVAHAEKLFAIIDIEDRSASDFIAEAVAEKLATIDLEAIQGQEALPLGKVAS